MPTEVTTGIHLSSSGLDRGQRHARNIAVAPAGQARKICRGPARRSLLTVALVLTAAAASSDSRPWPSFLPPPDAFTPDLQASIEHVWSDPTLSREVAGRPAAVPFDVYVAFVDAPDVTAAAARFLHLAEYEVKILDDDSYQADDHDGARGTYRVVARTEARRVTISWGRHYSWLLGTIEGSALTVVDLAARNGRVDQSLAAYVRIDNAVAAALARLLVPIFGRLADRKLREGFAVTASVAEWAVDHPAEFCDWLGREPFPAGRKRPFLAVGPGCR